jgi:UDP-N-acetylglucosamine--N-acetylmuramyl-(pentapeptide) pyrophosphoryl-undecaprenol N-acetylglucosamine transferase
MRVIFTCGGTAGHVNPALALAGYMQEKDPDTAVLFVGTPTGMERELVAKAGYNYAAVEVSSFQRKLNAEGIRHNLHTLRVLLRSGREARAILRDFKPDLVVGTGGYASYPMVKAAAKAHIPTAVHESNMVPGLTTKMLEEYAGVIMVGFEDCRQHYRHPERIAVTGTPVRGDFFRLSREEARKKLGFDDDAPLVVSFWGSLGASHMNEAMVDFFRREDAEGYPFRHIHAAGKGSWPVMEQKLRELGLPRSPRLDVRQYIYDMDVVMAAADVVLCRAGASTISELTALGKPTVMVPSPYVTNNHQEKNARLLETHGGAVVITEPEATGGGLYDAVSAILSDSEKRSSMARAMKELGIPDATERIYDTVMALVKQGRHLPPLFPHTMA